MKAPIWILSPLWGGWGGLELAFAINIYIYIYIYICFMWNVNLVRTMHVFTAMHSVMRYVFVSISIRSVCLSFVGKKQFSFCRGSFSRNIANTLDAQDSCAKNKQTSHCCMVLATPKASVCYVLEVPYFQLAKRCCQFNVLCTCQCHVADCT